MSVRIRFNRVGRTKCPKFRLVATDRRNSRDGKPLEILGAFDPLNGKKPDSVKVDRIRHWVSVGATLSDSVRTTLKKQGIWAQVKPGSTTGS